MIHSIESPRSSAAGVTDLWSTYRHCETTRDYIDLGLDCADHVLRVPRSLLSWVRLDGWVPQLGRAPADRTLQSTRLTMMDQVNNLEATLADCERQILSFEQIEARLMQDAGLAHERGDTAQLKRVWEEVRTCRERLQLEEKRRQRVRTWQQELWREAHELQDLEQERLALKTLEQVNVNAESRKAVAGRLNAAMTKAQLAREERTAESLDDETAPQDFAAFCAGLEPKTLPADRVPRAVREAQLA